MLFVTVTAISVSTHCNDFEWMIVHSCTLSARQISWSPLGGATIAPRAGKLHQLRFLHVTLLAPVGREAQLICRALEVVLSTQSRQHSKRQTLLAERAHGLRQYCTSSERKLWEAISAKKLGIAFRRQVPIAGKYIVDFLAPTVRLVVEVDGGYHCRRGAADARRDRVLQQLGYRVLRLEATLVMRGLPTALERIWLALQTDQ